MASASAFAPASFSRPSMALNGSVEADVMKLVVKQLGVDKDLVKPESNFMEDLNADSLDAVELIMSLEEEFEIEIPDDEVEGITTVQAAIDFVEKAQA